MTFVPVNWQGRFLVGKSTYQFTGKKVARKSLYGLGLWTVGEGMGGKYCLKQVIILINLFVH